MSDNFSEKNKNLNPEQNGSDNPNLEAKQLFEPMIFSTEDGKPLIPPMVFYDRPLDFSYPLPEITPPGPEYYINWKNVDKMCGQIVFPQDFLNGKMNILPQVNDIQSEQENPERASEPQQIEKKPLFLDSANILAHPMAEYEGAQKKEADVSINSDLENPSPYAVMQSFLCLEHVISINDTFYIYDGISYKEVSNRELARLILQDCRQSLKHKTSGFIDGIVGFLQKEPRIVVKASDVSKHLLAFQNGVLDLRSQKMLKHSPEHLILYSIQANYCPFDDIHTPVFDNYLEFITGGDKLLTERILQMIGYILTPDPNAKCFFLLQGVPDSGKSVFSNLLQSLFDENAVIQLEAHLLGEKFTASELIGKAFCTFPELKKGYLDAATVSRIKLFTGSDPISAPVRYNSNAKFVCSVKFIMATNHALLTQGNDVAFFNRVVTIPFRYSVPTKKAGMKESLLKERDGIVTKAMLAYFRLVADKYVFAGNFRPNEVITSSENEDIDFRLQIYEFTKTHFVPNADGVVFIDDAYSLFCNRFPGISKNDFSHYFQNFSSELFNAQKGRKRKFGSANPISCMVGISFNDIGGSPVNCNAPLPSLV